VRYYTRRRPQVDRCGSAWLIKRFVDPQAAFAFVAEGDEIPAAMPFDISGVELGHHRGRCTFETILSKHKLKDPALIEMGRIIRSADLLDAEETLEGPGMDVLFRGLLHLSKDDHKVLELSEPILNALYAALQERGSARTRSGRPRQKQ